MFFMQQAQDFIYGTIIAIFILLEIIYTHIVVVIILAIALIVLIEIISSIRRKLKR